MITLLIGNNDFEISQQTREWIENFDGHIEKFDSNNLDLNRLQDLILGNMLFAEKSMVVLRDLSTDPRLWGFLAENIDRVDSAREIVLVEPVVDKRKADYKKIAKVANIVEKKLWTDRDGHTVVSWVQKQAAKHGLGLDAKTARHLVDRVGIDQWLLWQAIEKLCLLERVDTEVINDVIDENFSENVFGLLELALSGDKKSLVDSIARLQMSEDPHRLFGLLSIQAFQLAAVRLASKEDSPSKDFGIHPFVAGKLRQLARGRSRAEISFVVDVLARADDDMKKSKAEPWILIESALLKLA